MDGTRIERGPGAVSLGEDQGFTGKMANLAIDRAPSATRTPFACHLMAACSFLKKRTKKLLPPGVRRRMEPRQPNKSFLLLFFKKEGLPYGSHAPSKNPPKASSRSDALSDSRTALFSTFTNQRGVGYL
jgi:hypothetical protein